MVFSWTGSNKLGWFIDSNIMRRTNIDCGNQLYIHTLNVFINAATPTVLNMTKENTLKCQVIIFSKQDVYVGFNGMRFGKK